MSMSPITPAGDAVRIADGKLLASDIGRCTYTSPVVQGRIVYFRGTRSSSAVELPEKAGDQIKARNCGYEDLSGEFFASPVIHDGRIYASTAAPSSLSSMAVTGKTRLKKTLELPPAGGSETPNVLSSICLAGKHLFVGNDAGESVLIEPGEEAKSAGLNFPPGRLGKHARLRRRADVYPGRKVRVLCR